MSAHNIQLYSGPAGLHFEDYLDDFTITPRHVNIQRVQMRRWRAMIREFERDSRPHKASSRHRSSTHYFRKLLPF